MVHISGCDSGACVCCASFECVGMCKYDDANVLFYACWFARRNMLWSSLQGFVIVQRNPEKACLVVIMTFYG